MSSGFTPSFLNKYEKKSSWKPHQITCPFIPFVFYLEQLGKQSVTSIRILFLSSIAEVGMQLSEKAHSMSV